MARRTFYDDEVGCDGVMVPKVGDVFLNAFTKKYVKNLICHTVVISIFKGTKGTSCYQCYYSVVPTEPDLPQRQVSSAIQELEVSE